MSEDRKTQLAVGQTVDGFEVKTITPLPELRGTAIELSHPGSGARLLHVHNADPENLFSISFPTPPPDDTGVPHILEHSVLAGSRKYPVKEPFFEMVKMSMATFINAMTGPDCTYYPVASNVKLDLFNLADVYFDAVFHPLLTQHTFKREAHHFAPADRDDPTGRLTINGIVYNEMKGAFSDPEGRLWRSQARGLFPDTPYGLESGGDPVAIPDLTYEGLTTFHNRYYHPGNARFFFYGNIPTEDYLSFLKDRLAVFERSDAPPEIPRHGRWPEPRSVVDTYPVGAEEPLEEKTYLVMSWATGDASDPRYVVLMRILGLVLFGNEAAPLKKALIDSGLGADVAFSGDGAMGFEATFSVGLKGSEDGRQDAFVSLVMDTLKKIAEDGLDRDAILAAFQQASYQYLEIQNLFPLHVMDHALQSWIYRDDPLPFLGMREHLDAARKVYTDEPAVFDRLVREHLLDNPHRLLVTLKPDRAWQANERSRFDSKMAAIRDRFSDEDMHRIAGEARELDRLNSLVNPPEELARLPQLATSDLPERLSHIPTSVERVAGVDVLRNDVFANGINYLALDFDLQGLPPELWPVLPRYAEVIGKLGAAGADYEEMAKRKAATTGGVGCQPVITTGAGDGGQRRWGLRFNLRALDGQIEPALEVLHDLLFGADPRDKRRLRDVMHQALARYRTDMVHHGTGTATCHAGRGFSPEGFLAETLHGLPQLHAVEALSKSFDASFDELVGQVEAVRDFPLAAPRVTVSFTGSAEAYPAVTSALSAWCAQMSGTEPCEAPVGFEPFAEPPREGLAGPIQVAHCAMVLPAPHFSHPDETLLAIGAHLLRHDYMLNEVRLKGNAYGAWFTHDPFGQTMQLGSFNDPHIKRTLDVFAGVETFVQGMQWTQTDVDRAIISTAKREERPIRPGPATGDALQRHLAGITPDLREERFARLKEATPGETKRALLEALAENLPRAAVCVVSSRQKLEAANAEMPYCPLAVEDILS